MPFRDGAWRGAMPSVRENTYLMRSKSVSPRYYDVILMALPVDVSSNINEYQLTTVFYPLTLPFVGLSFPRVG